MDNRWKDLHLLNPVQFGFGGFGKTECNVAKSLLGTTSVSQLRQRLK